MFEFSDSHSFGNAYALLVIRSMRFSHVIVQSSSLKHRSYKPPLASFHIPSLSHCHLCFIKILTAPAHMFAQILKRLVEQISGWVASLETLSRPSSVAITSTLLLILHSS
jgi:hypothetical protein